MPTARPRQLNVRLEEEFWVLIERLTPLIYEDLGVRVTASDLIRLGLRSLAKEYLPVPDRKPHAPG